MTSFEAAKRIITIFTYYSKAYSCSTEQDKEAVVMAVQALKEEEKNETDC